MRSRARSRPRLARARDQLLIYTYRYYTLRCAVIRSLSPQRRMRAELAAAVAAAHISSWTLLTISYMLYARMHIRDSC